MLRSRSYCFTLNNPGPQDCDPLKDLKSSYLVFGREKAPTTGTPHLQGFVQLLSLSSLSALKKKLTPGYHLEVKSQHSTFAQAIDYCKKDGDFYEQGKPPMDASSKGAAGKRNWEEIYTAAEEGRFTDIPAQERIRYDATLYRINSRSQQAQPKETLDSLDHEWHWGPPGTGKSRGVRGLYPDAYIKNANKWWCGYTNQPEVILDDLSLSHSVLGYHIKIWADHYPFTAETKGSALFIRPQKIIITSNYSPDEIFDDPILRLAIRRRFKITHYSTL